jgi:hypothetical protein
MYNDLRHEPERNKDDLMFLANITEHCVAFNTLGYLKSDLAFPLVNLYMSRAKGQGIYIRRSFLEVKSKELYGNTDSKNFANLIN